MERTLAEMLTPLGNISLRDVSSTLGVTMRTLIYLAHNKDDKYNTFEIPKRSGGTRKINAPTDDMLQVQRMILEKMLYKKSVSDSCCGFVRNRSIVDNSKPHIGKKKILKLDIKDFFPSISAKRISGFLAWNLGLNKQANFILTEILTYKEVLPQGAPTSPYLANILCRDLDMRLSRLAKKLKLDYTRYADDLTFSGDRIKKSSFNIIKKIIKEEGFSIAPRKTRFMSNYNRQIVTGLVVNETLNVPRKERRRLRAILHNCKKDGPLSQNKSAKVDFSSYLKGKIDFVNMVNPGAAKKLYDLHAEINWSRTQLFVSSQSQYKIILQILKTLNDLGVFCGKSYDNRIILEDVVALSSTCKNKEGLNHNCAVLDRVIKSKLESFGKSYFSQRKSDEEIKKFLLENNINYESWRRPLDDLTILGNYLCRHEPPKGMSSRLSDIHKRYCKQYPNINYPEIWESLTEEISKSLGALSNKLIQVN